MMDSKRICQGLQKHTPTHQWPKPMVLIEITKKLKRIMRITKHAKSIGKSHDLNAISMEYKQGQLVK